MKFKKVDPNESPNSPDPNHAFDYFSMSAEEVEAIISVHEESSRMLGVDKFDIAAKASDAITRVEHEDSERDYLRLEESIKEMERRRHWHN